MFKAIVNDERSTKISRRHQKKLLKNGVQIKNLLDLVKQIRCR